MGNGRWIDEAGMEQGTEIVGMGGGEWKMK